MTMIDRVRNQAQYEKIMALIESYLQKATQAGGFHTFSAAENQELKELTLLAERYEDEVLQVMPLPVSVPAVVQQKIQQQGMSQKKLAELLGMGAAKVSQILSGKREPDVTFLKGVHQKLGIDGNLILDLV